MNMWLYVTFHSDKRSLQINLSKNSKMLQLGHSYYENTDHY